VDVISTMGSTIDESSMLFESRSYVEREIWAVEKKAKACVIWDDAESGFWWRGW
jgi:hypothetical protein